MNPRVILPASASIQLPPCLRTFRQDFSLNHIIDPRTGLSPAELASVTVLGSSAQEADALSTAIMVMGVDQGLALIEHLPQVEALLVTKDLEIHQSPGFTLA